MNQQEETIDENLLRKFADISSALQILQQAVCNSISSEKKLEKFESKI